MQIKGGNSKKNDFHTTKHQNLILVRRFRSTRILLQSRKVVSSLAEIVGNAEDLLVRSFFSAFSLERVQREGAGILLVAAKGFIKLSDIAGNGAGGQIHGADELVLAHQV